MEGEVVYSLKLEPLVYGFNYTIPMLPENAFRLGGSPFLMEEQVSENPICAKNRDVHKIARFAADQFPNRSIEYKVMADGGVSFTANGEDVE